MSIEQEHTHDAQPERGVLDLVRLLKNGTTNPRNLTQTERRLCVGHLYSEGLSAPEIASILQVCDRTVRRDRHAIADENAIQADPALASLYAGRLLQEAETSINHIRRIARNPETPAAVRIDGERSCFQIMNDLAIRLQSLGFLPTASHRIEADLTHHNGGMDSASELRSELQRLGEIASRLLPENTAPPESERGESDVKGGSA